MGTLSASTMISVIMLNTPFAIPNARRSMHRLPGVDGNQNAWMGMQVRRVGMKHDTHQAATMEPAM